MLQKQLELVFVYFYNNNILSLERDFVRISGVQKLAMVDFPGKLASTVFTGGCNLRCPFCHNASLVTRVAETPSLSQTEVLSFLRGRQGMLEGVVLSGGEPLMQSGVEDFLKRIRALGFAIKLDTNGCYPEVLAGVLEQKLVDYVAMDIKNSPEKYAQTVGIPNFDVAPVEESIQLLRGSSVEFEFRTTVVREFHTPMDLRAIGKWTGGAPLYVLQQFVDSGDLVGPDVCHGLTAQEMQYMAMAATPYFDRVQLRGVE